MAAKHIDFNKLKKNISLPDFLKTNFDYRDIEGSTPRSPKLQAPDGHVIVIKTNHLGYNTYWEVHNPGNSGLTILDFIQDYYNRNENRLLTLREAAEVIQGYVNSGKVILPEESRYHMNNELYDENKMSVLSKSLSPLENKDFLFSRGITNETINSKEWKSVLFQKDQLADGGVVHTNTCVKMLRKEENSNHTEFAGISIRNKDFKGVMGHKYDTISASQIQVGRPIDRLYIGESFLDNMSHYQMFNLNTSDHVLYISTEGQLTPGQLETIKLVLEKNPIKDIRLINDNDIHGQIYNLRILGNVSNGRNEFTKFIANEINTQNEKLVFCEVGINLNKVEEPDEFIHQLFPDRIIEEFFEKASIISKGADIVIGDMRQEAKDHVVYNIRLPYYKEIIYAISENIREIRFSQNVKLELSKGKDFNQDLQQNIQKNRGQGMTI